MEKIPTSLFHMEAAGSLAPDLEGAPVSARHQNRANAKEHTHCEKKQADKASQSTTGGGRA
ncbi:hypothetical protein [uncultured Pseudoflavonifractor sp.]|uniref:hypothetical protein n=1 Tax=uncultured Pseudoflavonifractor sp. TaxID=1221379 RepID=UPI0025F54CC6|nr:hypothetical protein [uncultured Pseudoflavonifractor sp.]